MVTAVVLIKAETDQVTGLAEKLAELEGVSEKDAREAFRQHSYFSDIALGVICGFGANSYTLAMQAAINHLTSTN